MSITSNFINGRCFFNDFTPENDINPITGKAGIKYSHINLIGAILEFVGYTYCVHCKNGNCYIYKSSFNKWIKSHEQDLGISFKKVHVITSLFVEKYIIQVCEGRKKRNEEIVKRNEYIATRTLNPGKLLTYEEVVEKAERDFQDRKDKNEILDLLKIKLKYFKYKEKLAEGMPPYFHDGTEMYYEEVHWNISQEERNTRSTTFRFMDSLPGIDVTPYTGLYWK